MNLDSLHNSSRISGSYFVILFHLSSFMLTGFIYGQKSLHPKDTIYVEFDKTIQDGFNQKREVIHQDVSGIRFAISTETGHITLFYNANQSIDTISHNERAKYLTIDKKEIIRLHNLWIRNPEGDKPRPPGHRNDVFETFVLEKVSSGDYLLYPVTWLNN